MVMKKIRVAVWEYHTDEGKRRRGYFGDTVDLPQDEVERGTAAGAFDQPEPEAPAPEADPETEPAPADPPTEPPADQPGRPRATATAAKWAAYAKAIGIDPDKVDAAADDKDALIDLVDAAAAVND